MSQPASVKERIFTDNTDSPLIQYDQNDFNVSGATSVCIIGTMDFLDWGFGFASGLKTEVKASVSEAMTSVFKTDPPRMSFPFVWGVQHDGNGGPAVESPLIADVTIPLGDLNGISLRFDLEKVVANFIENHDGNFSDADPSLRRNLGVCLKNLGERLLASASD